MTKKIMLFVMLCLFPGFVLAGPPGSPPLSSATDATVKTLSLGTSSIRDNAGTLQISNGGGAWQNIGTASATISDAALGVTWDSDTTGGASRHAIYQALQLYVTLAALGTAYDTAAELEALFAGKQPLDADLTTAAGAGAASNSTYFGKNGSGTVGFHALPTVVDWTADQGATDIHAANIPTLNQNTTGTAAGLTAAYIDWNATSGGNSILNKPTVATLVGGTVPTSQLPANSAATGGIVSTGSGQVNKVWKTDADGIPGWRDDSTGGTPTFDTVGSGTNVSATMTVGAGGTLTYSTTGVINASQYKGNTTPTAAEFGYLSGVTSALQTQLNAKQASDADLTTYAGITPSANIQTFLGAADYAAMRTQLSLVPGTNVQAYDADLLTYAGITPSANVQSLLGAADYSAMRTLLSLVPGTNVQAYSANLASWSSLATSAKQDADAELTAFAGLTSAANALPYFTGSGTAGVTTLSTYARTFLDDADEATLKATLNMEAGVDFQAYSATLADIADGTIVANLVNTANPWADNEVANDLTISGGTINSSVIGGTTPAAGTFTTISAGASGFSVAADGATVAKSYSTAKVSGQASEMGLYEANSTDTDTAGFIGPSALTANTSWRGRLTARPTSDNMVLAFGGTAASGTGTPDDPYIHTGTLVDLDTYLLLSGGTLSGKLTTVATASGGAGLTLPHGTAPSSPVNGDIWTTTAGVYARINGGTVGPFGSSSADVTGGSASAVAEVAAYTDTTGKAIGRSYIAFSGPATSLKTKTISNADDTIAELGQTNNFTAAQTISVVNAASGSLSALTGSGTLAAFNGSDVFRGIFLDYTNANHTGTSNVVALLDIDAIAGDANSNLYGIRIGNLTGTTGAAGEVENAIHVGTGWDLGLYLGSPAQFASTVIFDTLDVGNTDTTLARVGAGQVSIEGVNVVTTSSTDTLTNKTLDTEGTGNSITTVEKIWVASAGCNNATAASFLDLPTTNAAAPACVTGTNTQKGVLDFDAATDESGQVSIMLPSDAAQLTTGNGVDITIKWLAAATSGSVVWGVQTSCVADAETDDPSWNTASTVTDAAKGTTLQTNDASIADVTATGCAAGELMHVRVYRDADNGSDDMTGDARLVGLEVTYRRAQ